MLVPVISMLSAIGCGGPTDLPAPDGHFPEQPLQTLMSSDSRLQIEVRTSPQPPIKGNNWVQYRITDQQGQPLVGAALEVRPWMPAHGHGGTVRPTVLAEDGGIYTIKNVLFYMAGHWELRSTIGATDENVVVPTFDVD
jgi:hypothetical protein